MKESYKQSIKAQVLYPLRYQLDLTAARLTSSSSPLRVLMVSDQLNPTSEYQFHPLWRYRAVLRNAGIAFDQRSFDSVLGAKTGNGYEVILAKLSFTLARETALACMTSLRRLHPEAKILYFDGDDDACVQWPEILPLVDLYIKKHLFADSSWYQRTFVGKNNLTDYIAREHGRSFADNELPHSSIVSADQMTKLVLGWNIALDDKIVDLFETTTPSTGADKSIDVMCRAACPAENWIYPLRGPVSEALQPLAARGFSVLLPDNRVDQQTYYDEMRRSRICVSPFGYGEVCWRDFEAVIMGSLLVKPDMGHLKTEPDIFIPGETYVPVRWDFSDLAEVCARYLADEDELERIASNAYRALSAYYHSHAAPQRFLETLELAGWTTRRRAEFPVSGSK